ncbi:MAG TPA: hypothetical protein PK624_08370 [Spirochaetota bacterium]|jgi:DNA-directed RNA polymerase subunit RPC12/RpoP|nr:hypothetical protein [Spirochaetota bacterium]MBP7902516.1 hypothetical protein [Spirochaetota bacterium]HOA07881.1 hypothetical protein [Spirochaetota bacterium]HOF33955.1 hypothetical protein [Spirochaetota bacterium]HOH36410.1 hypothetical protein [Spirochaetota bacterium]
MKCSKCGKEINSLNHHFIPAAAGDKTSEGYRLCIECAKREKIITLI